MLTLIVYYKFANTEIIGNLQVFFFFFKLESLLLELARAERDS